MEAFLFNDPSWTPTDEQRVLLTGCLRVLKGELKELEHGMPQFSGKTEALAHFAAGAILFPPKDPFRVVVFAKGGRLADIIKEKIVSHTFKRSVAWKRVSNCHLKTDKVEINLLSFLDRKDHINHADLMILDGIDEANKRELSNLGSGSDLPCIRTKTEGMITVDAFHIFHPNEPIPPDAIIREA
jgi:hypothetical protein